jgi:hypothetical protein
MGRNTAIPHRIQYLTVTFAPAVRGSPQAKIEVVIRRPNR